MNKPFTKKQHALLSLSVLILIIMLIYAVLINPAIVTRSNNHERIDTLSFQLSKFSDSKSEIARIKEEINSLKQTDINTNDFLKSDASAIVAADLQKKLKTIIESSGGNLVSTHATTDKGDDIYPKITVKVHMQVEITALQTVFYQLEINKPLLFIDNVLIQRRNASAKRQNKNSGLLEVRFDVTGYQNKIAI